MQRRTLRFVVLVIVALLVIGLVLATTSDPAGPGDGAGGWMMPGSATRVSDTAR